MGHVLDRQATGSFRVTPSADVQVRQTEFSDGIATSLAALAQICIAGFTDERPVTTGLFRSRLTTVFPPSDPCLVVATTRHDEVVGWAAIRPRDIDESRATLWGSVVAPLFRGRGLATALLAEVVGLVPGPLWTTDIPSDRHAPHHLFVRVGWSALPAQVLYRWEPSSPRLAASPTLPSGLVAGSDLAKGRLVELTIAAAMGAHNLRRAAAERIVARWQQDSRFDTRLLLFEPSEPALCLLLHQRCGAISELLVAEMWTRSPTTRDAFAHAAVSAARWLDVDTCRALAPASASGHLLAAGFSERAMSVNYHLRATA